MMIPAAWQMPLAVLGLALGLLIAAALVRRYQEYRAYQRARLRALVAQVGALELAIDQLSRVPLSQSLRAAVRGYIARQYTAIRKLNRAYPEIQRLEQEAHSRIDSDGGLTSGRVPAISDQAEFSRLSGAIEVLIDALGSRGIARGARRDYLHWLQEARERKAELGARFFIVQAHRAQVGQRRGEARKLLQTLLTQLYQQGPDTAFVRELYHEVQGMYSRAVKGRPLLDEGAPDVTDTQALNRSSAA